MDAICAEKTDNSIRHALENLPRTLSATFRRVLQNAKQEGRNFQKEILKIIVGASRPLVVAEFREALSVTPGDISWDPGKLINHIHWALACCGSLVIIDEEEGTIRLLHQSVAQFLHATTADSAEWSFTAQDANTHLGEITVTYLNYGVFDQRVSTRVVPKMDAGAVPDKIINRALGPLGSIGKRLANTALKSQLSTERNIGAALSAASNPRQGSTRTSENFHFLVYSSQNWLFHTSHLMYDHPILDLFKRLLDHPVFGKLPWTEEQLSDDYTVCKMSGFFLHLPSMIEWAILHSHSLLFSTVMHEKSAIKTLASVSPYISSLMDSKKVSRLSSQMLDELLLITTLFRAVQPTDWLLKMSSYSVEEYLNLLKRSRGWQYDTLIWASVRDCFTDLCNVRDPLLEQAIARNDGQMAKSLIAKGARIDIYTHESPLQTSMRSCFYHSEKLLLVMRILRNAKATDVVSLPLSDVFAFFKSFTLHANSEAILKKGFHHTFKFDDSPKSINLKIGILQRACERGDRDLVKLVLSRTRIDHNWRIELLHKTLFARSSERAGIVRMLVASSVDKLTYEHYSPVLQRSMQLRDWASAFNIARALEASSRYLLLTDIRSLHDCIDVRDIDGLDFLLHYTSPGSFREDQTGMQETDMVVESFRGQAVPLAYTFVSEWESPTDCCELLDVATYLQDLQKTVHFLGPVGKEIKRYWALKDHNRLALELCERVLRRYLIITLMSCNDHTLSSPPRQLGTYDSMAHMFAEAKCVMIALLAFMREVLEDFSGPRPTKSVWRQAIVVVLESYHAAVSLLHRIHTTYFSEEWRKLDLVDSLNCLKINIVVLAEALLRECATGSCGGRLDQDIYVALCSGFGGHMSTWQLHGIMGWLLWSYKIRSETIGTDIELKDPVQEIYAPFGIEALVLGTNIVQIFRTFGEVGLQYIKAAKPVSDALDFSSSISARDVRLVKSVEKWRAFESGIREDRSRREREEEIRLTNLKLSFK